MLALTLAEALAYIGANVRRRRASKEFTQQELETLTGFSVQYIRKIERGRVNVNMETLLRLANALDVAPGALLRKAKLPPAKPGRPRKRQPRRRT